MAGRILLVEDDAANRDSLALLLRLAGFSVETAADGAEALVHLRSESPPSMMLLDLTMPRVDGWEVLRRRREDPALSAVPVVVLSALGQMHRPALKELGVAEVVQKPADFDELLAVMRGL